jgi:ubiquinone/menaquinone biosynthesis C-methylase UbiE
MSSGETQFKDHFSALSAGYSKFRPSYSQDLFQYLSSITPANETAWDCATGSGQAAVALADWFDTVIATDASYQQIEQAYEHPSVEYRVAAAESSGLEATSVDLITVAQALHWFDIPRFMQEAKRVLKPKGIIAVWTYNLFRVSTEVDAIVDDLYWNILDGYWAPERKMVESGYSELEMPFRELDPPKFEMKAYWSLQQVIGYLGTWSAIGKYRQSKGEDPLLETAARLEQLWDDISEEKEISWPLSVRIGVNI